MLDNEEDIETGDPSTFYKPSFVLIAIDTDPSMFVKTEEGTNTPFHSCINACYDLANSLIFTQNKRSWSPFGIVLALEDASASFVNFNDNILNSIKFLKEKKDLTEENLRDTYQRKGGLDLSAFFLFCKKKFKEVNSVFYKRTIIYITNDDDPIKGDKAHRFAALNEAKNFEASSITFELVTMKPNFNYKIFYNELFSILKIPSVENMVEDEEGLIEKLSSSVVMRISQRKMSFFPFVGDQKRFLKVIQKSFIREERIYNNAFVSNEGKTLKKIPKNVADAIKKFKLKNSANELEFDLEERLEILDSDLPVGYSLLFVSNRITEVGFVLKDPVILEVHPKEDLQFFNSFWQYCVDKNKVLVCARKIRQPDKIRFVEFIPKFANNSRVFMVTTISFNDENNYPPSVKTDDEMQYSAQQLKVVSELIDNLTFDYHPKMFTNPSSAKKKAFLRSKFLDEPKEDVEDVTLDSDGIDKCVGESGEMFRKMYGLDEEEKGTKRKALGSQSSRKKK